ncbi:hypothetical protein NL390_32755, partial [Klebsiella pneumoniae]|nr:hypothetical protein [Klebsiella pneumoniae]
LLVDTGSAAATRESFGALGAARDHDAWTAFSGRVGRLAGRLFPTVTEPLLAAGTARALVDDDDLWHALVDRPLGEVLRETFDSDVV